MKNYVLPNYETPYGIDSAEKVQAFQRRLGVDDDGIWGPKTQAAYEKMMFNQAVHSSPAVKGYANNQPALGHDKLEQIIATIPGTTKAIATGNNSSATKLHNIIEASNIGHSLKNRAKYTVDALNKEQQNSLLLNVMLDGVDAYFSREAWDQGAYSLLKGDSATRLYENAVLPGEGPARRMLGVKLNEAGISDKAASTGQEPMRNMSPINDIVIQRMTYGQQKQQTENLMDFPPNVSNSTATRLVNNMRQVRSDLINQLQRMENNILQIPVWEKIPVFYSDRYRDALEKRREIQTQIAVVESKLDKLFPQWEDVWDIDAVSVLTTQPAATSSPTPSLTPTPNPTHEPSPILTVTPSPTPKPTPSVLTLPEDIRNAPVPDNEKLASHWDGFLDELAQTSEDEDGLTLKERYAIIRASADYIGNYPYTKVDCSKLVRGLYSAIGIYLRDDSGSFSSDKIAKYAFDNGWQIDKKDLKPGDLIFWDDENIKNRWNNIHHVGIYLYTDDKGKMWIIDSTPSEKGPAIQKLWAETGRQKGYKVFGYASLHHITEDM